MEHIAWLLQWDGTVRKVVRVERSVWPSLARVTFEEGITQTVPRLNVLSRDDLDQRYDFNPLTNKAAS